MILVNNLTHVKYKVVDVTARFFILERIFFPDDSKDMDVYLGTLVCITPEEFMRDFKFEGDLLW